MARTQHRPRHPISRRHIWRLKACGFRYSQTRDAYVLRIVGRRIGPVFQAREAVPHLRSALKNKTPNGLD